MNLFKSYVVLLVISICLAGLANCVPVVESGNEVTAVANNDKDLYNLPPTAPENFDNLMEIIAYIKLLRLYYKLEGRPR